MGKQKANVFIFTLAIKGYRKTKGSALICYTCGKECKIGESVFTKQASGTTRKIRHEDCARKVGLI